MDIILLLFTLLFLLASFLLMYNFKSAVPPFMKPTPNQFCEGSFPSMIRKYVSESYLTSKVDEEYLSDISTKCSDLEKKASRYFFIIVAVNIFLFAKMSALDLEMTSGLGGISIKKIPIEIALISLGFIWVLSSRENNNLVVYDHILTEAIKRKSKEDNVVFNVLKGARYLNLETRSLRHAVREGISDGSSKPIEQRKISTFIILFLYSILTFFPIYVSVVHPYHQVTSNISKVTVVNDSKSGGKKLKKNPVKENNLIIFSQPYAALVSSIIFTLFVCAAWIERYNFCGGFKKALTK